MKVAIDSFLMWVLTPGKTSFIYTFICWGGVNFDGRQDRNYQVFSMRIAIDYTAATEKGSGIGNYVRSLVYTLLASDLKNKFTLLTSRHPIRGHLFYKQKMFEGVELQQKDYA